MILRPVLGLLCCLMVSGGAEARPQQTTKYAYYLIGGGTAAEIYAAMLSHGPHVNGEKAYAATTATSSQDGKLVQAKTCIVQNYRLKIDFIIRLPQIKNDSELPGPDRSRWRQFSQFLKKHEETHRSIWLGCAQELENRVKAIRTASCGDAESQASKLWNQMRKACSRKHDAFDAAEQKRLLQHPFVRLVLRNKGASAHAAKAQ